MARKSIANTENKDIETEVSSNSDTAKIKEYSKTDMINCRSVTSGGLCVIGNRTGNLYQWADYGDIVPIEYQDLIYMIRANKDVVYDPKFIILDDDIVEQNVSLSKLYESLCGTNDFSKILGLPVSDMKREIKSLPSSIMETLKGIAATQIEKGMIDSISKVKALDEIFGTQFCEFAMK